MATVAGDPDCFIDFKPRETEAIRPPSVVAIVREREDILVKGGPVPVVFIMSGKRVE